MNETLAAALSYAARGWRVIPLHDLSSGHCSCTLGVKCHSPGKHPRFLNWGNRGTTNAGTITAWFTSVSKGNVGLPTGIKGKIVVLDVDVRNGGIQTLNSLIAKHGPIPTTVRALSGSGGPHIYFQHPGDVEYAKVLLGPGAELLCDGQQVLLPPSQNMSGAYTWIVPPDESEIAPLPDWIRALMRPKAAESERPAASVPGVEPTRNRSGLPVGKQTKKFTDEGVPAGGQRTEAIEATVNYWGAGHDVDVIKALIWQGLSRSEQGDPARPWTHEDSDAIVDDVLSREAPEPDRLPDRVEPVTRPTGWVEPFHKSDLGNARRFVARHGNDMRYCNQWGSWLIWNGVQWKRDDDGAVVRFAKDTALSIYTETTNDPKETAKWAIRSESSERIRAMIALAESEPGIGISPDALDTNGWLLNVQNGTLDLRTAELRPHNRDDLLTKLAPVTYSPSATCPTWIAFLERIMGGNSELIAYLQRASGYSLTARVSEQCLFFLYGGGSNGKSTFVGLLQTLLGDYAHQAPSDLLLAKRGDSSHPTELAALFGMRLVATVEVDDGRRMAESMLKQITGGDLISARRMREDFWTFAPSHKIFLIANHKPVIKGTDQGIWRRIHLVPFDVTIGEAEKDVNLPDKLSAELPGILAWCVRGCLGWQRLKGLKMPVSVSSATAAYRGEMDVLAGFISDCCVVQVNSTAKARDLFAAYTKWCDESGERAETQRAFGSRLSERGFKRDRGTGNVNVWHGIGVLDTSGQPPPTQSRIPETASELLSYPSYPNSGVVYEEKNISYNPEMRVTRVTNVTNTMRDDLLGRAEYAGWPEVFGLSNETQWVEWVGSPARTAEELEDVQNILLNRLT